MYDFLYLIFNNQKTIELLKNGGKEQKLENNEVLDDGRDFQEYGRIWSKLANFHSQRKRESSDPFRRGHNDFDLHSSLIFRWT